MCALIFSLSNKHGRGANATVFYDLKNKTATKVFKHAPDVTKEHASDVFNSETKAYEIASSHDELKKVTPHYFGKVIVDKITDRDGSDITNNYYTDLAYQMSFIEGEFIKVANAPKEDWERVQSFFHKAGVMFTNDASVIIDGDKIACVIDFALQEYEIEI